MYIDLVNSEAIFLLTRRKPINVMFFDLAAERDHETR